MATIAENIQTLRSIKSDIKNAIIQKGGSVTDAFGTYAQAITNLPSGGGGGTEIEDALITRTISGTYYNDRISKVGQYAFYYCLSLTSVNLPNCSYIDGYAFHYCHSLTSVNLQNCLSTGYGAFDGCSKLSSIDLPLCSYVGSSAFQYCYSLSTVSLPKVTYFGSKAFLSARIETLYMEQITSVPSGDDTFINRSYLKSIFIPSSLLDSFVRHPNWSRYSSYFVCV